MDRKEQLQWLLRAHEAGLLDEGQSQALNAHFGLLKAKRDGSLDDAGAAALRTGEFLKQARPDIGKMEAGGRGAAQGISLGFSDEIVGGLRGLLGSGDVADEIEKSRVRDALAKIDEGGTYMGGEIGASIAGSFIPGGAALKGGQLINKALKARTLRGKGHQFALKREQDIAGRLDRAEDALGQVRAGKRTRMDGFGKRAVRDAEQQVSDLKDNAGYWSHLIGQSNAQAGSRGLGLAGRAGVLSAAGAAQEGVRGAGLGEGDGKLSGALEGAALGAGLGAAFPLAGAAVRKGARSALRRGEQGKASILRNVAQSAALNTVLPGAGTVLSVGRAARDVAGLGPRSTAVDQGLWNPIGRLATEYSHARQVLPERLLTPDLKKSPASVRPNAATRTLSKVIDQHDKTRGLAMLGDTAIRRASFAFPKTRKKSLPRTMLRTISDFSDIQTAETAGGIAEHGLRGVRSRALQRAVEEINRMPARTARQYEKRVERIEDLLKSLTANERASILSKMERNVSYAQPTPMSLSGAVGTLGGAGAIGSQGGLAAIGEQ